MFAIERAEVLRLLPTGSTGWKLVEGHELEMHSGERVRVVGVELRGDYGPLLAVAATDGMMLGQYNLRSLGDDGQFARLWIDPAKNGSFFAELKRQEEEEVQKREEASRQAAHRKLQEALRQIGVLRSNGVDIVEHITHVDNLASILERGLIARNRHTVTFVDIADAGANARRDRTEPIYALSVHDYVPLYINAVNPMLSARRESLPSLVILGVSTSAILRSGRRWLITDGNAASSGTRFFDMVEDTALLDWSCLRAQYWNEFVDGKRTRCAEMLVESHVSPEWIMRIDCFTKRTMARAIDLAKGRTSINIVGRPDPFR